MIDEGGEMAEEHRCKHCGGRMITRRIANGRFIKKGRAAFLVRQRCEHYRPVIDWFLGRHSSWGDGYNLYQYEDEVVRG